MRKYLWHMDSHHWEKAMERKGDAPPKSIKETHERYLRKAAGKRKRGHKNR